jgi:hypothetical protein
MRYASAALILLGLTSVLACGTGKTDGTDTRPDRVATPIPSPAKAAYPTACSLINQEEMSRTLGGAVAPPEPRGTLTCTYRPAVAEALTPYAEIKIDWTGGEMAMKGMGLAGKVMGQDAGFSIFDRIDGVGDEASMMIGGVMNVRKGSMLITIDLRMQSGATEKGSAIAKIILARVESAGMAS